MLLLAVFSGGKARVNEISYGPSDSMYCDYKYKVKSYCQVGSLTSSTVSVAFTHFMTT